jgi:DNA-binding NtrC family response regulator
VLVVDDEEAVRNVAAGMLGIIGFQSELAPDGPTALSLFGRDPHGYELVLLDLTMPRMDGEETFRQLRLIRPDVRVVLMSGFNRADATGRFIGKGIAGFVQKPFGIEALTTEIRRILEK